MLELFYKSIIGVNWNNFLISIAKEEKNLNIATTFIFIYDYLGII